MATIRANSSHIVVDGNALLRRLIARKTAGDLAIAEWAAAGDCTAKKAIQTNRRGRVMVDTRIASGNLVCREMLKLAHPSKPVWS